MASLVSGKDIPTKIGKSTDEIAVKTITIRTKSKSSSWSPKEIINTGATLIWSVSGGVSIGDKKTNYPTFDLRKNTGIAIITIESSTNFAGLERIKIQSLDVTDVDLSEARDLFVFRGWGNQLKTFEVPASMKVLNLNGNALTSSELDGIVNDLDNYGLKNGTLEIENNTGSLTGSSLNSYQNLINKGWAINVPSPSGTGTGTGEVVGDGNTITIQTTSKSSSWSPSEIVNTGATLIWSVSGGVSIGEKKINDPTFDLSKNTGTAIITIKSSTNFAGFKRIKIQNLKISVVDISAAKELFVFRAYSNQLKSFKAIPSVQRVMLDNNALTSSVLDGIVNDLDSYGLKSGILEIENNSGSLTENAFNGYKNLINKGWAINVSSPSGSSDDGSGGDSGTSSGDGEYPILSNFRIIASQPSRVYFDSNKIIKASNVSGFIIGDNTISQVNIRSGQTKSHYFTVKSPFTFWDNNLIRYKGGSNFKDGSGNPLPNFSLKYIDNNLSEPSATKKIYYVSTSGSDSKSGLTKTNAWRTISKAAATATAGSTVWIKAGDYGRENVVIKNNGTVNNPIKFIGYDSSIGDNPKLTRKIGMNFSSSKMPLIKNGNIGINSQNKEYIIVKNLQISNYSSQGININNSDNFVIDNVYIKDVKWGIQTIDEDGSNNRIINSYIADCTTSGVRLDNKNNLIENVWVVSSRVVNMDYYINIYGGSKGSNNIIRNSYVNRYPGDSHKGHGISLKAGQTYYKLENSLIENSEIVNCGGAIEFRHSGVKYCVARNVTLRETKSKNSYGIQFENGTTHNLVESCSLSGEIGIRFTDNYEDGGTQIAGSYNEVINTVFHDLNVAVHVGDGLANNRYNKFLNSTFYNVNRLYSQNSGDNKNKFDSTNKFMNCIIQNVNVKIFDGRPTFTMTYSNFWDYWKGNGTKESGSGNKSVSSSFVNISDRNFRLRSSSKLINAGKVLEEVSGDFDGNGRPDGASHDMGAFEFQSKTSASKASEITKNGRANITTPSSSLCLGESTILTSDEADSYLWSTGETKQSIRVKPDGSTKYSLTVFNDGNSSSVTTTIEVVNCYVVGLENNLGIDFKAYPNPTNGPLYLNVDNSLGDMQMELINLTGRIVFSDNIISKNGKIQKQLDFSNIKRGIYLLKVYNTNQYLVKKIILN